MFDYDEHPGKTWFVTSFFRACGILVLQPQIKLVVEAPDEIQTEGPVLIISKHHHENDVPLGYRAMLQKFKRHAWCMMKAELTHPKYLGMFWKIGGIPLDRENPERSRKFLQYARKVLYERDLSGLKPGPGNMMVLFPEQTTVWGEMGEGHSAGFRFIAGKPAKPLAVHCVGIQYKPGRFRKIAHYKFGPVRWFTKQDDPAQFVHDRMLEVAELSGLEYPFERPATRAPAGKRTAVRAAT